MGYSKLQAIQLGYSNVASLRQQEQQNVSTPKEILGIAPKLAAILRPYLPKEQLDGNVGAFLSKDTTDSTKSEESRSLLKAKWELQRCLYLHGVLQGIADFWDAMFGIRMEYMESDKSGWNKNVRLLRLFDANSDEPIGNIYLDPFNDPYFRSESASGLVTTRLYSPRKNPSELPIAVVSLQISPTWDDTPTPLTWRDTRDTLRQLGKALQLILTQSKENASIRCPSDVSEFMPAVSL